MALCRMFNHAIAGHCTWMCRCREAQGCARAAKEHPVTSAPTMIHCSSITAGRRTFGSSITHLDEAWTLSSASENRQPVRRGVREGADSLSDHRLSSARRIAGNCHRQCASQIPVIVSRDLAGSLLEWLEAARKGESVANLIPVNVPATRENANGGARPIPAVHVSVTKPPFVARSGSLDPISWVGIC